MEEIKNDNNGKNLEESMNELKNIISEMEKQDISLEESFRLYKEGVTELRACSAMIDRIEKEMEILEEGGNDEV